MSTDWGEQYRCQRCGQWKAFSAMEPNADQTISAFCKLCADRLEEGGDPGGLGWLERFRQKIKDRSGAKPVSPIQHFKSPTLPRADQLPLSTEKGTSSTSWPSYGSPSQGQWKAKSCKHRGQLVTGVPNLMGSSYRGGLVMPAGGITVILTPEALADVQYLTGRGGAWATADGLGFPVLSKPKADVIFWPWPDMQVPTDRKDTGTVMEIAQRLLTLHQEHAKGRIIEVACFGGHGRTGMLLSILAALAMGWDPKDAVRILRKSYCEEAVETKRQEQWVEKAIAAVRFLQSSTHQAVTSPEMDLNVAAEPTQAFEPDDPVGQVAGIIDRNEPAGWRSRQDILDGLIKVSISGVSKKDRDDLIRKAYYENTSITQVEIADAVGLSPQRVSEIIKGKGI